MPVFLSAILGVLISRLLDKFLGGLERQNVGMRSEATDNSLHRRCRPRLVAKLLAGVNVRKMQLDDRLSYGADGVVQRDRRVAIGARIEADRVGLVVGFLDPVDEHALVVALAK